MHIIGIFLHECNEDLTLIPMVSLPFPDPPKNTGTLHFDFWKINYRENIYGKIFPEGGLHFSRSGRQEGHGADGRDVLIAAMVRFPGLAAVGARNCAGKKKVSKKSIFSNLVFFRGVPKFFHIYFFHSKIDVFHASISPRH